MRVSSNTSGAATVAPIYLGGMTVPNAEIGVALSVDLSEYFTNAVEEYMLQTGSLPTGFALNPVTCVLSGTSWEYSSQPISIRATHSVNGGAISAIVDFIVNYPESTPAPVATIMTDAETLPSYYSAGNNYFPLSGLKFSGITTYEGYAPHPVYFSGWTSTAFLNIKSMVWDFGAGTEGDEGGRYFEGINAGHLFETAGNYTVTLTVTDLFGRTATATRNVVIHASGEGNTSIVNSYALKTYYVDSAIGDDAYSGLSQTVDGGGVGPWKTFDKVIAAMHKGNNTDVSTWTLKPGDEVLFNKGQTFTSEVYNPFNHGTFAQGIHLGAYGTGTKPKVQWKTPAGTVEWQPNTAYTAGQYFTHFDTHYYAVWKVVTNYTSGSEWGALDNSNAVTASLIKTGNGGGLVVATDIDFYLYDSVSAVPTILTNLYNCVDYNRNICFARCHFDDPFNSAFYVDTIQSVALTNEPYGFFLFGCTASQPNVHQASIVLLAYGAPAALCLIGNTADLAGNHINYFTSVHNGIIADNTFSRPSFGRSCLRIAGGALGNEGQKVHVTRNKMLGWIDPQDGDILPIQNISGSHNGGGTRYNFSLINFAPNGNTNKYNKEFVFDRNIVTNYEEAMSVVDMDDLVIRNNIFITPTEMPTGDIRLGDASGGTQMRPLNNIQIYNNTFVHNGNQITAGTKWPMIKVNGTTGKGDGYHTGLVIINNAAVSVTGRDESFVSFQYSDNNQIPNMVLSNNLLDSPTTTWAEVAGVAKDLATWQTNYSQDVNSLKTTAGVTTPLTPMRHANGFPDSSAACVSEADAYVAALMPAVGSALLDAGYIDVPVYVDYSGTSRPLSNKDIGALEKV
jgi:hypothetical protein